MSGTDSGNEPPRTVTNTVPGSAAVALQVGTVNGDVVVIHPDSAEVPEVPREVPAPPGDFVRRDDVMSALDEKLCEGACASVQIVVLSGLPGVGKSVTVQGWVADVAKAGRYPGGELYVDYASLRTSEGVAVSDALADCLWALGVRQERIPSRLSARANLFRTKTAHRPVLVVLANVTEPAQVRPFVPKSAGSAVVVTSDVRLTELRLDGAHLVTLGPMDITTGVAFLRAMVGSARVDEQPPAAVQLVELCGGLPVALRAAATRLKGRPRLSIAELVDKLAVRGQLGPSAVFNNAYEALPDEAARLYRRLGAVPGRTFSLDVAAIAGRYKRAAGEFLLDLLADAHLVEETPDGRFRFHELIRQHAREKAAEHDVSSLDEVANDLTWYYLGMTVHADRAIMGNRTRIADVMGATEKTADENASPFRGARRSAQALEWLTTERSNVLAIMHAAFDRGWYEQVWQLTEAMTALYLNHRYLDDWLEASELGVAAAHQLENLVAEARLRTVVSRAYVDLDRPDLARATLEQARSLAERSGSAVLKASAWEFTGRVREYEKDLPGALAAYETALAGNQEAGERRGGALVKYFMGRALAEASQESRALALLTSARDELLEAGDQRMAGRVTIDLGVVHARLGRLAEAWPELERAVTEFAHSGAWDYEAEAREKLATVLWETGDEDSARMHQERAAKLRSASGSADTSDG